MKTHQVSTDTNKGSYCVKKNKWKGGLTNSSPLQWCHFCKLVNEKPIKSADYLLRNLRSIEDDDLDSELSEETLVEQQSRSEFPTASL